MPNNKQENQSLDADILQCKADLHKALCAIRNPASVTARRKKPDTASPEKMPVEPTATAPSTTDHEPEKASPATPNTAESSAPIRILSFDAIQQQKTDPQTSVQSETTPTPQTEHSPETTEKTVAAVDDGIQNELEKSRRELASQKQESESLKAAIEQLQQVVSGRAKRKRRDSQKRNEAE